MPESGCETDAAFARINIKGAPLSDALDAAIDSSNSAKIAKSSLQTTEMAASNFFAGFPEDQNTLTIGSGQNIAPRSTLVEFSFRAR